MTHDDFGAHVVDEIGGLNGDDSLGAGVVDDDCVGGGSKFREMVFGIAGLPCTEDTETARVVGEETGDGT